MSKTPKEIWEIQHKLVLNFDVDQHAELFAEDGVWEFPLARPGTKAKLEGRDAIRDWVMEHTKNAQDAGHQALNYDDLVIHETADPEVIVVEFDLHGEVSHTGEKYRRSYVQVLRVRDGKIVSLRDYFN
ncbi:MAG TPA: nuclear transport factor 2 family protein [Oligoflexus sp.]|uniref:nuclear transport factor 2 family protein n=1 Tax=Oligoflexus sp. TaxID=1971216 RepID=UPI002D68B5AB|nr:nuclear transport factor 2 family protein [Oligoflexus sp.]HYX34607.1 nuclear transport factor 2 family protein [Oligoflexus sp.]